MTKETLPLTAHLLRRAGFGATHQELRRYAAQGYQATVEELLHPESAPPALADEDLIRRYHIDQNSLIYVESCQAYWLYRMINTRRPLEEKIALFWHHVFATGYTKLNQPKAILKQVEMFRRHGLGSFRELLVHISRDPAMIFWLDNKDNHKDAVNENYGREILELFSMGVGNYTEDDVRQCSRAFTGWTIRNASLHASRDSRDSVWPYGRLDWQFEYLPDDHDHGEKAFLGERGDFNGEDAIDIICANPATARFVARHLYNFFVEDEPQVPAWNIEEPRNPDAIRLLAETFVENDYDIKPVLRVLFNSDFFKDAMYKKVKNPTEVVVGTLRLTGDLQGPDPRLEAVAREPGYMGQDILDPPSVEGWHTGHEWINSGSLVKRVNFVADRISDTNLPGVKRIVERISSANGPTMTPEELVENCLDQMGPLPVSEQTRSELLSQAQSEGSVDWQDAYDDSARRTGEMLALIGATREYQFG